MRRATIVLALILVAACGPPPRSGGEVQAAPSFDLPDLAGGRVSLASLKGRVVVLDFWATWCGPCIVELPEYNDFARRNRPKGVEMIGVVFDSGEPQEIQDFVREHRVEYRQLLGDDPMMEAFGGNMGFPTTFVIDREGIIRTKFVGSTPDKFERLQQAVDAAL
jgi:peroxiredoxin